MLSGQSVTQRPIHVLPQNLPPVLPRQHGDGAWPLASGPPHVEEARERAEAESRVIASVYEALIGGLRPGVKAMVSVDRVSLH